MKFWSKRGKDVWQTTNSNATTYEFTPYEFGSWDKDISAFTSTEYLGSFLLNGDPAHDSSCIENFDNLGFVLGTSSTLFGEVYSPFHSDDMNSMDTSNLLTPFMDELGYALTIRDNYAFYSAGFHLRLSRLEYGSDVLGCNDASKITIVCIPNADYAYQSNQLSTKVQYSKAEVDAMVINGMYSTWRSKGKNRGVRHVWLLRL
jgi:Lysophospholipase catalytic domain